MYIFHMVTVRKKEYNILYLMHGTGDDEKYWLKTNPYNKTMLDNMIADGDIEPLIVVTPTFLCGR